MAITITEALAEIKTVNKRLEKKRAAVVGFLFRQDGLRDPLDKDGGSVQFVARERQAIADLEKRIIDLRRGIQNANRNTGININGDTRTIDEWLTWRREVAPQARGFLTTLATQLGNVRAKARKDGMGVVAADGKPEKPTDYIINIDESALTKQIETMEDTLGQLDGQLSLKNATVQIDA